MPSNYHLIPYLGHPILKIQTGELLANDEIKFLKNLKRAVPFAMLPYPCSGWEHGGCDSRSRRDPLDTSPGVGGSGEGARNPSRGTGGSGEPLGTPPEARGGSGSF